MMTSEPKPRDLGRPRTFTAEDVFAATARVIARRGYRKLTLEAVAAEVGCTGPALSRRFGSKSGLMLAFFDWSNIIVRERFQQARQANPSPLGALRDRFKLPTDLRPDEIADPAGYVNFVIFHLAAADDPTLRPAEQRRRQIFEGETVDLLRAALAAGELNSRDVDRLGDTLLSALTGTALRWATDRNGTIEDRLTETFDSVLAPYRRATPQSPD